MSCVPSPKRTVPVFRPPAPPPGRHWFVVLVLLPLVVSIAAAQQIPGGGSNPTTAILGRVIDARDGSPVAFARLYLEPMDRGTARPTNGSSFYASRTVVADSAGAYAFLALEAGTYRVHVQQPGYSGSAVDVDLSDGGTVRITIGLEFSPVRLPAIAVTGEPAQPYPRTATESVEIQGARRMVVQQRQLAYLHGDVRTLTAGDVQEAITLAEADLFRALQRMPGVSRRDDYTAVLWTRGAPWVHTRVYFDGMPLYNPTHGGWLFSAVNPDGVGAAVFHPGVRSARWGEGAAAVLDLQSRTGAPGAANWRGEASLASVKLAGDGTLPGGVSWMFASRRTYVDVLSRAWEYVAGNDELQIPYDFADLIGRVDVPLPFGARIEASGLYESDRLRGDIPDLLERNRADWGNRAGRLTLRLPLGSVDLAATTGGTRFASRVDEVAGQSWEDPPTLSEMESVIKHDRDSFMISGRAERGGTEPWAAGIERIRDRLSYSGPFSLTGEGIPGLRRASGRSPYDLRPLPNDYTAIWGEGRVRPLRHIELQGGVRVEQGDSLRNVGDRRIAPRASVRWTPASGLLLSGGWGRSFQYTQAIGASGGPLGPQLHIGNLWTLAGSGFPALQADIISAGAEKWLDDSWLLTLNGYRRTTDGLLEPDPTPGPIGPTDNSVEARNRAWGVELSARRLVGALTLGAGYSYGESEIFSSATEAAPEGFRYPASSDVRHTGDVTVSYRFLGGWRMGGAYSVASGVPYTRIIVAATPRLGEPYAHRTPHYQSLDLMLDYGSTLGGRQLSAYIQLLNVLGRANAVTYAGSRDVCIDPVDARTSGCAETRIVDDFRSGLPRLPLFGLRVAF